MRKKFIAGNWKMYTTAATARELAAAVVRGVGQETRVTVAVCPPFPYLCRSREALRGSAVALGAQNVYPEKEGAFTGEVSPAMLLDVGCRYVILGHSERRHKLGETDAFINRKVHAALAAGLQVILCVGETLEEREANRTEAVLETQLTGGLAGVDRGPAGKAGDGLRAGLGHRHRAATPRRSRRRRHTPSFGGRIGRMFGEKPAATLPIQYGGSVKPDNAATLLRQPDVDGALVGGASLKADRSWPSSGRRSCR